MSRPHEHHKDCEHVEQMDPLVRRPDQEEIKGCEECLAQGMRWVHLRMCMTCGHIGCCNSSPGRHATQHHVDTHHPIVQSVEPFEDWLWCYFHGIYITPEGEQA